MGNVHIYDDHIEELKRQTKNKVYDFPTLKVVNKRKNIEDYTLEDFVVENYYSNDKVIMKMHLNRLFNIY